jgi:hypothetical protein
MVGVDRILKIGQEGFIRQAEAERKQGSDKPEAVS